MKIPFDSILNVFIKYSVIVFTGSCRLWARIPASPYQKRQKLWKIVIAASSLADARIKRVVAVVLGR